MGNQKLKVSQIADLFGKNDGKPFWTVETDQGKMNAFDKKFVDDVLRKAMNGSYLVEVSVETSPDGRFTNIRPKRTGEDKTTQKPLATAKGFDSNAMYVAYAKDIFVALLVNYQGTPKRDSAGIMDDSITLVKQAKEGLQ